jgi:hypothetical protein
MKRCTKDNLKFSDDRRFCSTCGAVLIEEFELVTLIMPKIKIEQTKFIKMNDDFTFKLSIRNQNYKLSMDEVRTLAAEMSATVKTAELHFARSEN